MVRQRYHGLAQAERRMAEARAVYDSLHRWRLELAPGGEPYWAVVRVLGALNDLGKAVQGRPLVEPPAPPTTGGEPRRRP